MAPVTETRMTITQLTEEALLRHEASQSGASNSHRSKADKQDDRVSVANTKCGTGSTHSLSSDGSKFISRYKGSEVLDAVARIGMLDQATALFNNDVEGLATELDQMIHIESDVQREEEGFPVITCFSAIRDPLAARRAVIDVNQTFADNAAFLLDATVKHRNTAELPETLPATTAGEKKDKGIDIEKASATPLHPIVGIRGSGLAIFIAALAALGVVAFLAIKVERSIIAACGLSLVLAMGVLAFMMK